MKTTTPRPLSRAAIERAEHLASLHRELAAAEAAGDKNRAQCLRIILDPTLSTGPEHPRVAAARKAVTLPAEVA